MDATPPQTPVPDPLAQLREVRITDRPWFIRSAPAEMLMKFLILMLAVGFGAALGFASGRGIERTAAVSAGVGSYGTDKKTGATSFIYARPKARVRAKKLPYPDAPPAAAPTNQPEL